MKDITTTKGTGVWQKQSAVQEVEEAWQENIWRAHFQHPTAGRDDEDIQGEDIQEDEDIQDEDIQDEDIQDGDSKDNLEETQDE